MTPIFALNDPTTRRPGLTVLVLGSLLAAFTVLLLYWTGAAGFRTPDVKSAATGPGVPLKIFVREPGIYQITAAELEAFGWHPIEPHRLALTRRGIGLPLRVFGSGRHLKVQFFAQANSSRYTAENVYVLRHEAGSGNRLRMGLEELAGDASDPMVDTDRHPARFEENRLYEPVSKAGIPWYWLRLVAPSKVTVELNADSLLPGGCRLRLSVWGKTRSPQPGPDHRLRVLVNDVQVADQSWEGNSGFVLEVPVSDGVFQAGRNDLTLEAPGVSGIDADIILLDWIELDYPRPVQAVGPQRFRSVSRISMLRLSPDLHSPEMEADYLAIGEPRLLEPLGPLVDLRRQQGLRVSLIPLQAVYDQFGDGVPGPEAVRAFLAHARERWKVPPRYLLLVGDGSHDTLGFLEEPAPEFLPAFFIQTTFGGEAPSDLAFVKSEGAPFMSVGRLPARSPEQVRTFVSKVLRYEQDSQKGSRPFVAVAGGPDRTFHQAARTFLDRSSGRHRSILIDSGVEGQDAREKILKSFEEGAFLFSYFGHGSIDRLGKESLFTVDDASGLANHRLPVMLSITCLSGLYTHPGVESLAEAMLWNPRGGAIAVLAATSLTLLPDQMELAGALAEAFCELPEATLGEIVRSAQLRVPTNRTGTREVLDTFHLFGDPALRMRVALD